MTGSVPAAGIDIATSPFFNSNSTDTTVGAPAVVPLALVVVPCWAKKAGTSTVFAFTVDDAILPTTWSVVWKASTGVVAADTEVTCTRSLVSGVPAAMSDLAVTTLTVLPPFC